MAKSPPPGVPLTDVGLSSGPPLKQLGRCAPLNHYIYIAADPTPVDVAYVAHACHCIVRPHNVYPANHDDPSTLLSACQ